MADDSKSAGSGFRMAFDALGWSSSMRLDSRAFEVLVLSDAGPDVWSCQGWYVDTPVHPSSQVRNTPR